MMHLNVAPASGLCDSDHHAGGGGAETVASMVQSTQLGKQKEFRAAGLPLGRDEQVL